MASTKEEKTKLKKKVYLRESRSKRPIDVQAPEREPRRRKPDAMARAQAEVDERAAAPDLVATDHVPVEDPAATAEPFTAPDMANDADALAKDAFFAEAQGRVIERVVEPRAIDEFVAAAEEHVLSAGALTTMPLSVAPRELSMADLPARERRALAAYASKIHCDASQIEAFESGEVPSLDDRRARQGTNRLIELGLLAERRAYFVTELGARVARSGGIEVTRPIAQDTPPVKAAS